MDFGKLVFSMFLEAGKKRAKQTTKSDLGRSKIEPPGEKEDFQENAIIQVGWLFKLTLHSFI